MFYSQAGGTKIHILFPKVRKTVDFYKQKPPAGRSAAGVEQYARERQVPERTGEAMDKHNRIENGEDWYPPPKQVQTRHSFRGSRPTP